MISSCSQRILSYQKDPKLLMFRRDLELTKTSPVGYADFALLDPFLEDEFPSWFSTQDKCGDDSEDRSLRAKKAFKKLDLNGSGNVRSMAALVTCFVCLCVVLGLNLYECYFCQLDIACKWYFRISMIMIRSTRMFWFCLFINHEYQAPFLHAPRKSLI